MKLQLKVIGIPKTASLMIRLCLSVDNAVFIKLIDINLLTNKLTIYILLILICSLMGLLT